MKKLAIFCFIFVMCNAILLSSTGELSESSASAQENCGLNARTTIEDSINDCSGCIDAISESCVELHAACISTYECTDWFECIKTCNYSDDYVACHEDCDDDFFEEDIVLVDLKTCMCDACMSECYVTCENQ